MEPKFSELNGGYLSFGSVVLFFAVFILLALFFKACIFFTQSFSHTYYYFMQKSTPKSSVPRKGFLFFLRNIGNLNKAIEEITVQEKCKLLNLVVLFGRTTYATHPDTTQELLAEDVTVYEKFSFKMPVADLSVGSLIMKNGDEWRYSLFSFSLNFSLLLLFPAPPQFLVSSSSLFSSASHLVFYSQPPFVSVKFKM